VHGASGQAGLFRQLANCRTLQAFVGADEAARQGQLSLVRGHTAADSQCHQPVIADGQQHHVHRDSNGRVGARVIVGHQASILINRLVDDKPADVLSSY
jgi:hypothetical protein